MERKKIPNLITHELHAVNEEVDCGALLLFRSSLRFDAYNECTCCAWIWWCIFTWRLIRYFVLFRAWISHSLPAWMICFSSRSLSSSHSFLPFNLFWELLPQNAMLMHSISIGHRVFLILCTFVIIFSFTSITVASVSGYDSEYVSVVKSHVRSIICKAVAANLNSNCIFFHTVSINVCHGEWKVRSKNQGWWQ